MWTSLCNFLCNKFFHKPALEIRRSDDSCGVYGKRLKLIDRIWNSNGVLNRAKSSSSLSMQKDNFDISDDEGDCCIIAEIPKRKIPVNSSSIQKAETLSPIENSELHKSWSSFSFCKEPCENCSQDKDNSDVKVISKLSGKNESPKVEPKKIFSTQRGLSQGKVIRSKIINKNLWRKKLNFLQESYRLNEKLQYIQLLRSQTTNNLMTAGNSLKNIKSSKEEIEVINLFDDEPIEITEETKKKGKPEEHEDVQIVGVIKGAKSFQDILKHRPLNVELALKTITSNKYETNSESLKLPESQIILVDDDIIYDNQKTDALEEKLRDFMQITSPIVHEVENREPFYLPALTVEQEKKVKSALIAEPSREVLSVGFGLQITRQDMQTLAGLNWLNDEIINFYMNLIMERSKLHKKLPKVYAFNTFFYPKLLSGGHQSLRRWTKQVDIFTFDIILVPVHLGMHWCLSVIDFRSKSVKYYDSIGSPNNRCLEMLLLYLKAESLDKRKKILSTIGWEKSNVRNIPQQMNGSDCGVFSCMFAEYLSRDNIISFTQDDMPYFRKKMVIEILEKKLLT